MKKWIRFGCLLLLFAAAVWWVLWANEAVEQTDVTVTSPSLPDSFRGFRIAHISDLHNAQLGENNADLLALLRSADPDIIAITGDLIDSRRTDADVALHFVREAVKIAPCYYATGNHESRIECFSELEQGLRDAGVTVLRNASVTLERGGESIQLIGLDDYTFFPGEDGWSCVLNMLASVEPIDRGGFDILLAHRPEFWAQYVQLDTELILAGHAHGGQFRLPLVGGLYAPDQGFFPQWDAGAFSQGDTTMVVSRGLGNSLFPLRVNNRPEVVIITLEKE